MPVGAADLEWRLSGGKSNANGKQSLGGEVSDHAVTSPTSNLLDFVHYNEAFFGDTEYRCLYLKNTHGQESMLDLILYVVQGNLPDGSPSPIELNVTFDPNGLGDGRNNGIAYSVPNEGTAPVIDAPTNVSASAQSGGSLSSGTYYYVVTALTDNGETIASAEVSAMVDGSSTQSIQISWDAVPGATNYRVYGRAQGSPSDYWETSNTNYTDTGGAGTSGSPPGTNGAELVFPNTPPSDEASAIGHINLGPNETIPLWLRRTVPMGTQISWNDDPVIQIVFGV